MADSKIKLEAFEPTIQWWRHCLDACGYGKLAQQYSDEACWSDAQKAYQRGQIPEAVVEAVVDAVANCAPEHSFVAFTLMRIVGPRPELIEKIVQSQNAEAAYAYCRYFGDRPELRTVIRDKADPSLAFYYCRDVANDPEVASVVLRGRNEKIKRRLRQEVG